MRRRQFDYSTAIGSRLISQRTEGIGLALFTAFSWGLNWPQSKFLLTMLPPFLMRTRGFEHPDFRRVSGWGWVSVGYISTIPMTVAYLAWFRSLRMVPASTAATTVLLSPVVGVMGSGIMLGEVFGPRQIVALVMTLTGVALAARG